MRPVNRKSVSKYKSSRMFKRNVKRTKMPNLRSNPMRGGWRM
jgi:hypothetical protein